METTRTATDVSLAGIRRGVSDPKRSAEFYAWLLGLTPEPAGDGYQLRCANGELVILPGSSTPIAMELNAASGRFQGSDPDGVPVGVSNSSVEAGVGDVRLDHVSMNCADLAGAIEFYRGLGFVLTWSGSPGNYENPVRGFHETPVSGADWVHVSGADGYLALSQADDKDFGIHNSNSGPPRLVHVGFGVSNVATIAVRLDAAGIPHSPLSRDAIGERLYLNDPDGVAALGNNIEVIQYLPGVARSGKPPY